MVDTTRISAAFGRTCKPPTAPYHTHCSSLRIIATLMFLFAREGASDLNNYRKVSGVGGWGGLCTCPDGRKYEVGDNNNHCKTLACEGGKPGSCKDGGIPAYKAGMKVTCAKECTKLAGKCTTGACFCNSPSIKKTLKTTGGDTCWRCETECTKLAGRCTTSACFCNSPWIKKTLKTTGGDTCWRCEVKADDRICRSKRGSCPAGYVDITGGKANNWACGAGCPIHHKADDGCACSCQPYGCAVQIRSTNKCPQDMQRTCGSQANKCSCAYGYPKTGSSCTRNGAAMCRGCGTGYYINSQATACVANKCSCAYGYPKTGSSCTRNGAAMCSGCNTGYTLNSEATACLEQGDWVVTEAFGCETRLCGKAKGASGYAGTVTCSEGPGRCVGRVKPAIPVCPKTPDCVCFPNGTFSASASATCDGRKIDSARLRVPIDSHSTGYPGPNNHQGKTLSFQCDSDANTWLTYQCRNTGQFCSTNVCPASWEASMKQCSNVVVDSSCKDASDSHNGPKCVEIISQMQNQQNCSGSPGPDQTTGCTVITGINLLYRLNLADLILEIFAFIAVVVSNIYRLLWRQKSTIKVSGVISLLISDFGVISLLVINWVLQLSAFIFAGLTLPGVQDFSEARCFQDTGDNTAEIENDLKTILGTGVFELLCGLGLIALEAYNKCKSDEQHRQAHAPPQPPQPPQQPQDLSMSCSEIACVAATIFVDFLELGLTCSQFYFTQDMHDTLQTIFSEAIAATTGSWCFACKTSYSFVNATVMCSLSTLCVVMAVISALF